MQILIIGCEYTGKTTLAQGITRWHEEMMGPIAYPYWHDHFVLPNVGQGPDSQAENEAIIELLKTVPSLVEKFQRFQILYHLQPHLLRGDDFFLVNWYYADAVYGPLYYGDFKSSWEPGHQWLAQFVEHEVKALVPEMLLTLVKASPEVVRERMRQNPQPNCPIKESDVEIVLDRFEEHYKNSLFDAKITIDTTNLTIEQTLEDFVHKAEPFLRSVDRQRILNHQVLQQTKSVDTP